MNGKLPDEAIRKALRHQVRGGTPDCPDENALSAYLEGALTDQEKSRVEEHAACCAGCQAVLALCLKAADADAVLAPSKEDALPSPRTVFFGLSIPLAGLAAAILCVVAGVVVIRSVRPTREAVVATQIADARRSQPEQTEQEAKASAQRGGAGSRTSAPAPQPAAPSPAQATADAARAEVHLSSGPAGKPLQDRDELQSAKTLPTESLAAAPAEKGALPVSGETSAPARRELREKEAAAKAREVSSGVPAIAAVGIEDRPASAAERKKRDVPVGEEAHPQNVALGRAPAAEVKQAAVMPEAGAREALRILAEGLSRARTLPGASRKVLDRTFHEQGAYWVDAACAGMQDQEVNEIRLGSAEYEAALSAYPGIREMLAPGKAVLLCRDHRIVLIR